MADLPPMQRATMSLYVTAPRRKMNTAEAIQENSGSIFQRKPSQ
jgi:hypothetical protein